MTSLLLGVSWPHSPPHVPPHPPPCHQAIFLSATKNRAKGCWWFSRGTPKFDLVSAVWPPVTPKVRWCQLLAAVFRWYFGLNKFSQPNGPLLSIACHPFMESLCINGQFRLSGNNFSASYEASDFYWQIAVNSPQHLGPCCILSSFLYPPSSDKVINEQPLVPQQFTCLFVNFL